MCPISPFLFNIVMGEVTKNALGDFQTAGIELGSEMKLWPRLGKRPIVPLSWSVAILRF